MTTMRFLAPSYLHLAWLVLIPVALHLFRRRAKQMPVSALLFFRSLAREHQESAWLRRLKKWIALLLAVLILLLGVFALARPTASAGGESPGALVIVLDRSASMAAKDDRGRTRLDEAREWIRRRIQSLPGAAAASLIAFDTKPSVLISRSRNRRELLRLLEEVQPQPREGRPEIAIAAAGRLAALDQPAEIWLVSDESVAPADSPAKVARSSVALDRPVNAGITAFQIRRSPLSHGRHEALVQVTAAAANPGMLHAELEVEIGGRLAQLRELDLKPGEPVSLSLPVEGARGQAMQVSLRAEGDCLGYDNAVIAPLPDSRALVVAWFSEEPDPFTGIVLGSLVEAGELEILKGGPQDWPPKEKPDIFIFEHWLPPQWPDDRPVIALNPRSSSGPVRAQPLAGRGVPHDAVRIADADHAVTYRITASPLAITQTCRLDIKGSLQPVWIADNDAVLAVGEVNGSRVVVSAVSPSQSERFALLPAFPLMLGNAVYWCAESVNAASDARPLRPGDWLRADGMVRWRQWDGEATITASDEPRNGLIEVARLGSWEAADGRSGSAVLASARETDVPKREAAAADAKIDKPAGALAASSGNWHRWLIWSLIGLLMVESFLFHRKAVY